MERGDLLETYRTCLQEKRKLESDLNSMRFIIFTLFPYLYCSGTKAKFAQTIHELRSDIADLQAEVNSKQQIHSQQVLIFSFLIYLNVLQLAERSALLLQVETLNHQLVETAKKASDWETDANKLAMVSFP
jgi:hypothetical protein